MAPPSFLRPVFNRAVHLRITPRPSNLGESQEILRLISRYGEVEYFKNFKYDALPIPGVAIAIFKDESAANNCLRNSPLRFRMGRGMPQETTEQQSEEHDEEVDLPTHNQTYHNRNPFGLEQRRQISTSTASKFAIETSSRHPERISDGVFQIQVQRSRTNFRDQINVGHYFNGFAVATNSITQTALEKSVPLIGLSCLNWKAAQKPWRLVQKESKGLRNEGDGMKTLRELYEEGATDSTKDEKVMR